MSQKDLLGLYSGQAHKCPDKPTALEKLRRQGFRCQLANPDHWILRRDSGLTEIHLYGERELTQFARRRAEHYSFNASTRSVTDELTHLPD